jgi:hypothetical protein
MAKTGHFIRVLAVATLALLASSLVLGFGYADRAEGGHSATKVDREDSVEPFNQGVFVVVDGNLRNPTFETSNDTQLFNNAGTQLGITWNQWKSASATAKARVVKKSGRPYTNVEVELNGLVPGGVYSLFYATFEPNSSHPLCPGVERTLPLVSRDRHQSPDASSFVADANGEAVFRGKIKGRLLKATRVLYTVIYHFDGLTYHPLPNRGEHVTQGVNCRSSFGNDAMRQLIIIQKSE